MYATKQTMALDDFMLWYHKAMAINCDCAYSMVGQCFLVIVDCCLIKYLTGVINEKTY